MNKEKLREEGFKIFLHYHHFDTAGVEEYELAEEDKAVHAQLEYNKQGYSTVLIFGKELKIKTVRIKIKQQIDWEE